MKRAPLYILTLLMATSQLSSAARAGSKSSSDWDDAAKRKKAEYIFLQGQSAYAAGDFDDYALLSRRAFDLDSADLDVAAEWAMIVIADPDADSLKQERAYQALSRRFYSDPSDYLTGIVLANVIKRQRRFDDLVKVWETLDTTFTTLNQPGEELAQAYLISFLNGDSTAYDKAIRKYESLELGTGKNINLSAQKIRAFSIKNDTASIIKEVEDLAEFAPSDSYVAIFAGTNYQALGNNAKALEFFQRACQLDSTNGSAYMAKAALYHQMGDSIGFDREVFQALKSTNLEVDAKLEILRNYVAELYTDPSQESRIRELFGQLEQMHSGEPEIHNLYGAYLYEIEDYAGGAEQMGYSTALDPSNEGVWSEYVRMLGLANETDMMINRSLEAMERFPDNLYFPIMGADGYRTQGKNKEALDLVNSVEVSTKANANATSSFIAFRGDLLALNGDTLLALKAYDEAIEINPDNYMALNNAAYFMAENNIDLDKAERYITTVVRQESDNPTYLDTYAWVFYKKKDYTLARQYIDMTINLYNSQPQDSDQEQDEVEVVVNEDDEITEKTPSSEIFEHAGDIYFMDGEHAKAVEFWKKAFELDPDNELLSRKVKHETYFYK